MEVSNNQIKPVTLAGAIPTKVSLSGKDGKSSEQADINNAVTDDGEKAKIESKQAGNLHVAVSQINDHVQNIQNELKFSVDDVSGQYVVTITDKKTKEVIRQMPSEEALAIARRLTVNKEESIQLISFKA